MAIDQVINLDENQIPQEGSASFRSDASYVWRTLPSIIQSMNVAIDGQNSASIAISSSESNASQSASSASSSKNETEAMKNDVTVMKDNVETMEQNVEDINNGIASAISDAVNQQFGEYTYKIQSNSMKIKMNEFGIGLNS